ncbi:MAG: trigger factor [Deltaproteobacteria bacterium CG11_big_fil_rev_8_21_14_0_20_47_16]|nr:MAG: trigger factor [Deltaproteobacteria bacterium CG11_big_fil_rev_8_21_14_0_20_47_16]
MKTEISDVTSVKKKINVEVPADKVNAAFERAFAKVQKEASIKGFRKGKVPQDMIEKHFGNELVQEALEEVLQESYVEAMQASNLIPISRPDINPGQLNKGKVFTYEATFEVRPEVTVKNYTDIKLKGEPVEVTNEEVENELKRLQELMAQMVPPLVGAGVGKESVVTVDYTGKVDGKDFPGNTASDFVIDIPAGNLLPAFSEKLIGASLGDVREFEIDYPADYFNKELAGKKGQFSVTIKDIKTKVLPEINDDFAKDLAKGATLLELRGMIRKDIEAAKERNRRRELGQQALDHLVEKHDFEIPTSLQMLELRSLFEQFQQHLQQQNQKLEDIGMTPEKFIAEYSDVATRRVRGYLILDAIAEAESLSVTDEDLENFFQGLSAQLGEPVTKIRAHYDENERKNALKVKILQEKTLDFVIDKAKIGGK